MGRKKKDLSSKKPKSKPTKTFNAQVNCTCKRNCAGLVDVLAQKDIFDNYHCLTTWSGKTKFLRSIVNREPLKENLDPCVNNKNRNFCSSFHLNDTNRESKQVCSSFLVRLLQISRGKLYRAAHSTLKNPDANERRGKHLKKRTQSTDLSFMENFLKSLPCYESKINSVSTESKYLHPSLTLKKVYEVYRNMCTFKQRLVLSKGLFGKMMKDRFSYLKPFVSKSVCHLCKKIDKENKRKVMSLELLEKNKKDENEHLSHVKNVKLELLQSIKDSDTNCTEILTFELQRPLEMPCVSPDESYDCRQLWFSNLCIFDEIRNRAYMYVWDESIAQRGPEEIGSCILKHIFTVIPKTTNKIILYSKSTGLYRNMKISLMLKKVCDLQNRHALLTIEHRFFFKGHDSNDCNKCFEAVNNKRKTAQNLFAPKDWMELIASAKPQQPFTVINMTENDFFSVARLINSVNEKYSSTGQQIPWSKISIITHTLNEPLNLRAAYNNKESAVFLLSDRTDDEFRNTKLVYSCKGGNSISKAKFDNLQMNLKFIPIQHHDYYKSLKFHDSPLDKDFALASYDSTDDEKDF